MGPSQPTRVLLVEDDLDVAAGIGDYLAAHGLQVDFAGSADEARARVAQSVFDLLVLDVNLPGQDGIALCRELKQGQGLATPAIFLTARSSARLDVLDATFGDSPIMKASSDGARARLIATQGGIEEARELAAAARETVRSAGMTVSAAGMSLYSAWVEQRAGDAEAWERALLDGLAELEGSEERAFKATITGYLAQCLCEQGRYDEAFDLCPVVRETSPADDLFNFIYADMIEGSVLVRRERNEEGLALLSRALDRADATDFFFARAEVRLSMGDALALVDEDDRAKAVVEDALEIYRAKGDVTGEARARERSARHGIAVA